MYIKQALDHNGPQGAGGYKGWVQKLTTLYWPRAKVVINWKALEGSVNAKISHSVWCVQCPFCPGAILAQNGEPFFCPDCAMQGNNGHPMSVVWPENVREIETELVKRPDPNTRNWTPGETVEMLQAENRAHGIGV